MLVCNLIKLSSHSRSQLGNEDVTVLHHIYVVSMRYAAGDMFDKQPLYLPDEVPRKLTVEDVLSVTAASWIRMGYLLLDNFLFALRLLVKLYALLVVVADGLCMTSHTVGCGMK